MTRVYFEPVGDDGNAAENIAKFLGVPLVVGNQSVSLEMPEALAVERDWTFRYRGRATIMRLRLSPVLNEPGALRGTFEKVVPLPLEQQRNNPRGGFHPDD